MNHLISNIPKKINILLTFLLLNGTLFASQKNEPAQLKIEEDLNDYIEKIDPNIEFLPLTPQLMANLGIENAAQIDAGFSKWLILFNEIPGEPPYQLQEKRILQFKRDTFRPLKGVPESSEIAQAKKLNEPIRIGFSSRGYLPGEKVVLRLSSKDKTIFKEITICPRPLVLKKASGEILAKAFLSSHSPELTMYTVDVLGVKKEEEYKIISCSGKEKLQKVVKGPISMGITPNVVGDKGGFGELKLCLEDNSSYKLRLPWGSRLTEYSKGDR